MKPRRKNGKGWKIAIGSALLAVAALGVVFHPEIPAWTLAGASSFEVELVGSDTDGSLCPARGQTIELRGDSIVLGSRMGGDDDAPQPYGAVLAQMLGPGVTVLQRGRGGATAADGFRTWRGADGQSDIILLAYGTNDAAVRGWLGGKRAVPLAAFRTSLLAHTAQAQRNGAQVGLIAPPPVGSAAMSARLQPYRRAVRQVGRAAGVPVFDPAAAFAECADQQPLLLHDALHPNQAGHTCMGRWLAGKLQCAQKSQP